MDSKYGLWIEELVAGLAFNSWLKSVMVSAFVVDGGESEEKAFLRIPDSIRTGQRT